MPAMTEMLSRADLSVGSELCELVESHALPGTGIETDAFWASLSELINTFTPRNRELLETRASMQAALDGWYRENPGPVADPAAYRSFLEELGYIVPEGPDFAATTQNVDAEMADVPGPQLVVPIMNARYALNAANARWGSLYDALYGTDALGPSSSSAMREGPQAQAACCS